MYRPTLSAARAARRARAPWLVVSLCLAALVSVTPARAQSPGAPAATSPDAEVKRLYKQGVEALKLKQWDKAIEALLQAFQRNPLPQIAANLGHAEFMAGKYKDAVEHLSLYLREGKDISEEDRQTMQREIAESQAKLGMVTIRVDVDGADLLVDSQKVGVSPLEKPALVEPGSRTFEAKKEGLPSARQVVEVAAGTTPVVELKLAPVQAPSPSGADPHQDEERWRMWATAGGLGLSAVGLGVGIGLTVAANAKRAEAVTQHDQLIGQTPGGKIICGNNAWMQNGEACNTLKDTLNAVDRMTVGAITAYTLGEVAAVGTAVLLLWPKEHRKSTGVLVTPTLGGVVMVGSF